MSLFTEIPIKSLVLEHPLHYASSVIDLAKMRSSSALSPSLRSKLENHCSALNLDSRYIDEVKITDFVAKAYNIVIKCNQSDEPDRLWTFAATLALFLFQFDDHFDTPCNTPENTSRLSIEVRTLLNALSKHGLSGLQGDLDEWPTTVPLKEAYLWLLREGEDLRKGTAELLHHTFLDYCFGVELELLEWAPDIHQGDTSAWNLCRYSEVRKRSGGVIFTLAAPLYVTNKWLKKENFTSCSDLLNDEAIVCVLANDIVGMKKEQQESQAIGMTALKFTSANEVAQHHNDKVMVLRKNILGLDGDKKRFMEEIEVAIVGLFLWQCNARRYSI